MTEKGQTQILILAGIVILMAVAGGIFYLGRVTGPKPQTPVTTPSPQPSPTSQPAPTTDETANWKIYTNEKYGFELKHPPQSTIESRDNKQYQYIRIQNYTDKDYDYKTGTIPAGKYYLEISIFDHQLGNKNPQSCNEMIVDAKSVNLDGFTGYRGEAKKEGGDPSKHVFALCINKPTIDYYVQVSEDHETVANKILSTFKFLP